MVKSQKTERRKHPRVEIRTPLDLGGAEGDFNCYLKDISRVGCSVVVNRPLDEFEILGLRTVIDVEGLPQVDLDCQGLVVRCRPLPGGGGYDIGLYFHEVAPSVRESIDRFVAAALEPQATN